MRAAVASSDGIVINQHFGRADVFYIYEVSEVAGICFVEKRRAKPFCHGGNHEEQDLLDATKLLTDCGRVFVSQLGRGAQEELRRCGIEPVVARGIIEEVLLEYQKK